MVGGMRRILCLWNIKEGTSKRINRNLKSSGASVLCWVESG